MIAKQFGMWGKGLEFLKITTCDIIQENANYRSGSLTLKKSLVIGSSVAMDVVHLGD